MNNDEQIEIETPEESYNNCEDGCTNHRISASSESVLENMFCDRYTTSNESFAKICEGFDPVICLHPFHSRPKRNFESQYRGRGGWGQGRGEWRGGRGRGVNHWHNNDRRGQQRPWNDRSDYESNRGNRKFRRD